MVPVCLILFYGSNKPFPRAIEVLLQYYLQLLRTFDIWVDYFSRLDREKMCVAALLRRSKALVSLSW